MKEEATYKVKVQVGDASVEIEGPKDGAVELLKSLTAILQGRAPNATKEDAPPESEMEREITASPSRKPDIRSFFEEKQLKSDIEAAAATAFFYQYVAHDAQKKDSIGADDLAEAFRLAKRKLPTAIGQTLRNTKNAGYLDSGNETGHYKLNPVGYNLVEHTLGKDGRSPRTSARKKSGKKSAKGSGKTAKKATRGRRTSK